MKRTLALLILVVLFEVSDPVNVRVSEAFTPLRWVYVHFSDDSTLICRVGEDKGTLLKSFSVGVQIPVMASCNASYSLTKIEQITINGQPIGLNPYLGLTDFIPSKVLEMMAPEGEVG